MIGNFSQQEKKTNTSSFHVEHKGILVPSTAGTVQSAHLSKFLNVLPSFFLDNYFHKSSRNCSVLLLISAKLSLNEYIVPSVIR